MKCARCNRQVIHPHHVRGVVYGRCCAEMVGEQPQQLELTKQPTDIERLTAIDWSKVDRQTIQRVMAAMGWK